MTMVIDFVDGFEASQTPNLLGLGNEIFPLANNVNWAPVEGLSFPGCTSAFGTFEIERRNALSSFRMSGSFIASLKGDGSEWELNLGGFQGDDLFSEIMTLPQKVFLQIDESGQFYYRTGSMDPYQYEGFLKINLNRINA